MWWSLLLDDLLSTRLLASCELLLWGRTPTAGDLERRKSRNFTRELVSTLSVVRRRAWKLLHGEWGREGGEDADVARSPRRSGVTAPRATFTFFA